MRRTSDAGNGFRIHSEGSPKGPVRTWTERNGAAVGGDLRDATWEAADARRALIATHTASGGYPDYATAWRALGVAP